MADQVLRFVLAPESEGDEVVDVSQGVTCDVEMQKGAEIVGVGPSSKGLLVWAVADVDAETEIRTFFVVGNGVDLPEGAGAATYRGTFKVVGHLTAHVFEIVPVAV